MSEYADRLRAEFQDEAAARWAIEEYFATTGATYTGSRFDSVRDAENPNRVTAVDLVAVSTLSVTVPPRAALYLLGDEGTQEVEALLREVPETVDLWDDAAEQLVSKDGPMWQLWDLARQASWPAKKVANGHNNVGETTASKLLAAKRPRLIPVYDSVVRAVLSEEANRWLVVREALCRDDLRSLVSRATDNAPPHVSLLRRIDVVIWMRNHQRVATSDA